MNEEELDQKKVHEHRLKVVIARARSLRNTEDLRAVLLTEAGRRVLWGIMESTGIHADPRGDWEVHAGMRRVGLALRASVLEVSDNDAHMLADMETLWLGLPEIDTRMLKGVGLEDDISIGSEIGPYDEDENG
jgi:hypothetical protein